MIRGYVPTAAAEFVCWRGAVARRDG